MKYRILLKFGWGWREVSTHDCRADAEAALAGLSDEPGKYRIDEVVEYQPPIATPSANGEAHP